MSYIVTHPGQAHFDEFMACCLMLAMNPSIERIERREPTVDEIYDAEVYVVDCGTTVFAAYHEVENTAGLGILADAALRNFEHHHDPECPAAFVLVARALGLEEAFAASFPWWAYRDMMDRKGPFATNPAFGLSGDTRLALSPIEGQVLRLFGDRDLIDTIPYRDGQDPLAALMSDMGHGWITSADEFRQALSTLEAEADAFPMPGGLTAICADVEVHSGAADVLRKRWMADSGLDVAMSVFRSPRGGYSVYRYEDHPKVDTRRLLGFTGVRFVHGTGFLLGTEGVTFEEAIKLARKCVGGLEHGVLTSLGLVAPGTTAEAQSLALEAVYAELAVQADDTQIAWLTGAATNLKAALSPAEVDA